MKLKTKIAIDRFIGLPLVYLLNVLARILGFFLRINHSLDLPVKTIAICKYVGLGSIIQATPLIQTLRKNYPDARIVFITNESNKTLFNHIAGVDEVFTISDKGLVALLKSTIQLLLKLWKNRPEIYIDLEIYSNYSSVIATMSLSKNRMGFFKNDKMYRMGMHTHMLFFNVKAPISQTYLQFARLMGCKTIETNLDLNISSSGNDTLKNIHEKLKLQHLQKYIVINPNASDLRLERRWAKENVIALINTLCEKFQDYKIILVGNKAEADYVSDIYAQLKATSNVINSSGKLTITELMMFIKNATLMITNDTGPMHIAFALKTKTIALFGPCSPQQYGGLENSITIYKNVYCSPCVHEFITPPCKGDNQCMKKITVDEVLKSISDVLNNHSISTTAESNAIAYLSDKTTPLGVVER